MLLKFAYLVVIARLFGWLCVCMCMCTCPSMPGSFCFTTVPVIFSEGMTRVEK